MSILLIFLTLLVVVLFILVLLNVNPPQTQKAINLVVLGILAFILLSNGGWINLK